jgi:hypothetical protein
MCLPSMSECCQRVSLRLGEVVGEGEFGRVYKGVINMGSSDVTVAVKTLKGLFSIS